jgi:hypothetical protein
MRAIMTTRRRRQADMSPRELRDSAAADLRNGAVDLLPEDRQCPGDAGTTGRGQAEDRRATDEHGGGADRERLDDVAAARESTVALAARACSS